MEGEGYGNAIIKNPVKQEKLQSFRGTGQEERRWLRSKLLLMSVRHEIVNKYEDLEIA